MMNLEGLEPSKNNNNNKVTISLNILPWSQSSNIISPQSYIKPVE